MKKQEQVIEEVKEKFMCVQPTPYEGRSYQPGEMVTVAEGTEMPNGFLPFQHRGPQGIIEHGPWYFCLREVIRGGKTYKPGWIWSDWKELPPEKHFAPLEDREFYEKFKVSNEYELRKIGE